MEKTKVMAKFSIQGDEFDPSEITNLLELSPRTSWSKGDPVAGKPKTRSFTYWSVDTGYEESLDVNIQVSKLLEQLKAKRKALHKIRESYDVDYFLILVVHVENDEKPAIHFQKDVIHFASEIDAEIDVDLYIY